MDFKDGVDSIRCWLLGDILESRLSGSTPSLNDVVYRDKRVLTHIAGWNGNSPEGVQSQVLFCNLRLKQSKQQHNPFVPHVAISRTLDMRPYTAVRILKEEDKIHQAMAIWPLSGTIASTIAVSRFQPCLSTERFIYRLWESIQWWIKSIALQEEVMERNAGNEEDITSQKGFSVLSCLSIIHSEGPSQASFEFVLKVMGREEYKGTLPSLKENDFADEDSFDNDMMDGDDNSDADYEDTELVTDGQEMQVVKPVLRGRTVDKMLY
ncbi:hypothetical protein BGZ54_009358 [Gamsiella multidivaricata]|nr:hypothetical protein BGZ54_009358 [Gamsiella multidivaricata]